MVTSGFQNMTGTICPLSFPEKGFARFPWNTRRTLKSGYRAGITMQQRGLLNGGLSPAAHTCKASFKFTSAACHVSSQQRFMR